MAADVNQAHRGASFAEWCPVVVAAGGGSLGRCRRVWAAGSCQELDEGKHDEQRGGDDEDGCSGGLVQEDEGQRGEGGSGDAQTAYVSPYPGGHRSGR